MGDKFSDFTLDLVPTICGTELITANLVVLRASELNFTEAQHGSFFSDELSTDATNTLKLKIFYSHTYTVQSNRFILDKHSINSEKNCFHLPLSEPYP